MTYRPTLPFAHTSGPHSARIAIVGEAWGEQEALLERPFIGASGQELTQLLREAEIPRQHCFLTNVFPFQPPGNKIESICVDKAGVGKSYPFAPMSTGKYIPWEYLPELERLQTELLAVRPNLVLALGNTACWAMLGTPKITSIRGVAAESTLIDGLKVLPTFHPAYVLRNWSQRVIVSADLIKARREAEFPEIRRPRREIHCSPTIEQVEAWTAETLALSPPLLSCDIETKFRQIEMVGFSHRTDEAMVIPFMQRTAPEGSYWHMLGDELRAWACCKALLESPIPKLGQNFLYDLQYLVRMGILPRNCQEDTMLLHHSHFPELQKSLGFMGSIHTNEASWKLMRHSDTNKRDE